MRIYLNTSALNRPFDDLSSSRVRLEADAVAGIVAAAVDGRVTLIGSEVLDFEVAQNPDPERAARVQALVSTFPERVATSERLVNRARGLERLGLRGVDALHVAAAEAGGADLLVTTDDRMRRRARRADALFVRVLRPQDALAELEAKTREEEL